MLKRKVLKTPEIALIQRFVQLLRQKGIDVSKVILFGSHAKGMAKQDSDIDLAIVSTNFGKDHWKEMVLLRKLALEIDSQIEPLPLSPYDLNDRFSSLSQEIKKTGISLNL